MVMSFSHSAHEMLPALYFFVGAMFLISEACHLV